MAIPVFDGHNDVLLEERSFADASEEGHLDLARARAGGFAGGFFAIFTQHPGGYSPDGEPEPPVEHELAIAHTFRSVRKLLDLERAGAVRIAREPEDLVLGDDVLAVMHIEGAEAIDPGLELLPALHAFGLRSLGITWSRPNAFGVGVESGGGGLTDAGRALVRGCEELGILVDLSHLSEEGFWDVAKLAQRPLVATHACAAALVGHARNLTDAQLDAVGDSGGVVGVCFHREFAGEQRTDIARHVEYIAERIGVEHVALGSDFDGCDMPEGIRGAQDLQLVLDDLGWGEPELRLVAHENFLRVLRQVQNAASSRAMPTGSS
jgi:membrane dipeptidase